MSPGVFDKQANTHLALINMAWKKPEEPKLEELSEKDIEAVTVVFRSFETGLREATIYSKVEEMITDYCQAQSKPQLQLRWTEMSLISNSFHPPTHPPRQAYLGPVRH